MTICEYEPDNPAAKRAYERVAKELIQNDGKGGEEGGKKHIA